MNSENSQLIQSYIDDGDARKETKDWGAAKISYLNGIEEFNAVHEMDPDAPMTEEVVALKKQLEERIEEVNEHLGKIHFQKGLAALENKAFKIAVDELEEATRLAREENVEFLEEIKVSLDKARIKERDHSLHLKLSPFVERGDDFRRSGNYAEAVLEYQDALKQVSGLPDDHRFISYISNALTDCRRNIIRPYLAKIYKACFANRFKEASELLKRAQQILDQNDSIYTAFLEQMKEKINSNLKDNEIVETEEFETQETWEQAVKDYEEALDLYSSFTVTDPFAPAYSGVNVYEDRFFSSRKNLGRLYKNRADKLRDQAKVEKAIRNYKEALKLLPRSDKSFHEAFKEMKKLRGQIAAKTNK